MARIYVVDDDEQLLRMVGLMLERGGHTITLISDPVQGLAQVKADKPDLLVLDVMMPNMSGHEVTRQIRATKGLENLPILILTARSQEVDRMTALKSGASDYLSKPVTSQELIEQVDALLTAQTEERVPEQGMVIAVYGLRGGVGRTTVAVNLAAALRRVSQQAVCLVDLTPSIGQAVLHMRLQPRSTWADLLDGADLNWNVLRSRLLSHQSGLHVLAAPTRPQSPTSLTAEESTKILSLLRERMRFTVIDLPNVFSPSFNAGLASADIALHVITPEVIAVQTAAKLDRALSRAGVTFRQKSYILNQTKGGAQLPRETVERGLKSRIAFSVGYDPNQDKALSQGVPLSLTSAQSPLALITKKMAEVIWKRVGGEVREDVRAKSAG